MRTWVRQVFGVMCAFAGGAITSAVVAASRGGSDDTYRHLAVFARVLHYVENNYVTPVEPRPLVYGAIRGMLASLDPHSTFMDPEQYAALKSEVAREFGGIGVDLVRRENGIFIVSCQPGSPAARSDLAAGDAVVAVSDESVESTSLAEVVRRIKGTPGSVLRLTVRRAKNGAIETMELMRERIRVRSVDGQRLDDGTPVLWIKSFTDRTFEDTRDILGALSTERPIHGLVIDLRDNPGGLLDEAVRVADLWLEHGVIVTTETRGRTPVVESAHPRRTEPPYPVVLLVNGGTASAAEILAGALQDHGRALVVGTQTYGKGSVQTIIELEDQSALKLTVAHYFTPKHRSIQGSGITPDRVIPPRGFGAEPMEDPQLHAASRILARWARSH